MKKMIEKTYYSAVGLVYLMSVSQKKPVNEKDLCVTRDMRVLEIIALFPQAADIMQEYGLHCFSCHLGGVEKLEEGCKVHAMEDEMIEELLDDINTAIAEAPDREWTLEVTPEASQGIADIAKAEGREGQMLHVTVDESGGFCLEFTEKSGEFDKIFFCKEHPDVKVCASPLALQRVGGGTIDMRDGRFKLDLPEDGKSCCGEGGCNCK
tara:strand:- start:19 stop:645 length:627 start_codon:yes stop_codon:yes gene_type:complete